MSALPFPAPSSASSSAAATQAALTPAQLKAQLWADSRQHVYALAMGSRIGDLQQRLAEGDVIDHDCLLPGALSAAAQATAPYLVQLRQESPFTDWLLFEAAADFGDWGLIGLSPARRLDLRLHWRGLLEARLPEGQAIELDWMDPEILQRLLPLFDPTGLGNFMGPVQAIVLPGAEVWATATAPMSRLAWQRTAVAGAKA